MNLITIKKWIKYNIEMIYKDQNSYDLLFI